MEVRLAQSRLSAAAFLLGIDKHQLLLVCAISTSWLKGLSVRAGAYESERLGMNADVSTAEHRHQTAFTFLLDLTHMSLLLLVGSSFLPCFSSASWFTNNFPSPLLPKSWSPCLTVSKCCLPKVTEQDFKWVARTPPLCPAAGCTGCVWAQKLRDQALW